MMAGAFLVGGFILMIVGIALYSVPLALVVAGTILFVAGGLDLRNQHRSLGQ